MLSGGLDLLFNGQQKFDVPQEGIATIQDLIRLLAEKYIQERPELFRKDDSVYFFSSSS